MVKALVTVILDAWRDRVVPLLWVAFFAGVFLALARQLDDGLVSLSLGGLDETAREVIRSDLTHRSNSSLAGFDAWLMTEIAPGEGQGDRAVAGALIRYFRFDRRTLKNLGSPEAWRLISWAAGLRRRTMAPLSIPFLFVVLVICTIIMIFQQGKRPWRSLCYFTSRLLVIVASVWSLFGIVEGVGHSWALGTAASQLTSLPATVTLWVPLLSAGSALSWLCGVMIVACVSECFGALYPDP
ncbi:MAG: hypothetical protein CSA35_06625 [Dethiosulfovibrio peptidovorans]|nr:MAG: hypothetical protein CSA35_06625 [Dethiosulfovibrio peptidovorans]